MHYLEKMEANNKCESGVIVQGLVKLNGKKIFRGFAKHQWRSKGGALGTAGPGRNLHGTLCLSKINF